MTFDLIPGVTTHARIRFCERFGADPPRAAWQQAILDIVERRALLLSAGCSRGTERWRVMVGPIEAEVWWMPSQGCIISVIAPGMDAINPRQQRRREAQRKGQVAGRPAYRRERVRVWEAAE